MNPQEIAAQFNELYKIPRATRPTLPTLEEACIFKGIFQEEVDEVDDLFRAIDSGEATLEDYADWLADLITYLFTHADKHGFPIEDIVRIVAESNMSKLGEDGQPIYDERGKVMKGPNYFPPEPALKAFFDATYPPIETEDDDGTEALPS